MDARLGIFLTVLVLAPSCAAVTMTRCELVAALTKVGFPSSQMRSWVCVVEAESNRNTAKKVSAGSGTFRWGLFQLADPTWCSPGLAGGGCGIKCEDMLTDDIKKASACASTVYKKNGFGAWPSWPGCQKQLPDISSCQKNQRPQKAYDLLRRLGFFRTAANRI